ncbi:KR domain-containing protein, partial [Streptomyces sp. NRRL F-525]|uniref:KR domain-containing protein n=1 Tax=Streptomyces sp. NRRL F-525 TaxID=1463861 RepID=UPI00131CC463
GVTHFIELGPDAILTPLAQATLGDNTPHPLTAPLLRRNRPDTTTLHTTLAQLHTTTNTSTWTRTSVTNTNTTPDLPTYAFQHQRYWLNPPTTTDKPATGAERPGSEGQFWTAVERGDVATLAGALDVDDAQRRSLDALLPVLSAWRRRGQWQHRISWKPVTDGSGPIALGSWLVVVPEGWSQDPLVMEMLRSLAEGPAARVIAVVVDSAFAHPRRLARLLLDTLTGSTEKTGNTEAAPAALAGVLSLLALDERPAPGRTAVTTGLAMTVSLVQALGRAKVDAPLWVATSGAVSVRQADRPARAAQAAVWGLGQAAAMECPERWGGLVDLPEVLDERVLPRLARVLAAADGEDQVAVRASGVYGRRLTKAAGPSGERQSWRPQGTVLITARRPSLGLPAARWVAQHGAAHLLLAGTGWPVGVADTLTALGAASVEVVDCDPADGPALAALLARVPAGHPLTGVVHAAAELDAQTAGPLNLELAERALASVVPAVTQLDALTRDMDLAAFVVFSSVAGTLGGPGVGNAAPAHAFLDAVVARRRAEGLPGLSVAWGPWSGPDDQDNTAATKGLEQWGLRAVAPGVAVAVLEQAAGRGAALVVADIDWQRLVPQLARSRRVPLFEDVPEVRALLDQTKTAEGAGQLLERLSRADDDEQLRLLLDLVRTHAAAALGHSSPDAVGANDDFLELGFSSFTVLDLSTRLRAASGLALPPVAVYEHPSPAALADRLRAGLAEAESPGPPVGAAS